MIFTTGPLPPRGAYKDSSSRRFACSTVGIPALRFKMISLVCELDATRVFYDARVRTQMTPENPTNPIPNGVRAIAALFALCAIYLAVAGAVMLLRPGAIAMSAGAPLLFGLELAGP